MFEMEWEEVLVFFGTAGLVVLGPLLILGAMAIAELWHQRRTRKRDAKRLLQRGFARWRARQPASTSRKAEGPVNGRKMPLHSLADEEESLSVEAR